MNHKIYFDAYRLESREWVKSILNYIKANGKATVTDIEQLLGVAHSDASQKLSKLKKIGYVKASKQGAGHYVTHTLTGINFKDIMVEYRDYLNKITQ